MYDDGYSSNLTEGMPQEDLVGLCQGVYEKFWHVPEDVQIRNNWRRATSQIYYGK